MAGEGGARLAVNEESDLRHRGHVGAEGGADRDHRKRLGFEAGGMACGEGAGEVDDGHLIRVTEGFRFGGGHQENLGYGGLTTGHRVGGARGGIEIEEPAEYRA